MSRPLFPFVLLGQKTEETVGDTIPAVAEETSRPVTVDNQARDFRPINTIKDRVPPAPGPKKVQVDEDPKASSATVVAGSSPSESPTSPVESEVKNADAEKVSSTSSDEVVMLPPLTTGINLLPVEGSTPETPVSQTSSSPLL